MPSLGDLREEIDKVDNEIVRLLVDRAARVLQVKEIKQKEHRNIYSPAREREIIDRVLALADGKFPPDALERIFLSIISASRSLIGEMVVSYLGPECSWAFDAAVAQFGENVRHCAESSLEEICKKVERGDSHFGVVPIETSSSGLYTKTLDVLMASKLKAVGEVSFETRLDLVGSAAGLSEVKHLFADADSFAASTNWVRTNLPGVQCSVEENAMLAAKSAKENEASAAIVGSSIAGRMELKVLASGIQNELGNVSRFLIIGLQSPPSTGRDKTTLLCAIEERSGALFDLLKPFAKKDISLSKIESKPMPGSSWEYVFYIDLVGHESDPLIKEAIVEVGAVCSHVKVLGSYPIASKAL